VGPIVVLCSKSRPCKLVCVGDFNSVRSVSDRRSRGTLFCQVDADIFNNFIDDSLLVDLSICGRLFTWYRGDGISMSRLDRFLLSGNCCDLWPNRTQVAHQRGFSDHVTILVIMEEVKWGPRPLMMLKCWAVFPGYAHFVCEKL